MWLKRFLALAALIAALAAVLVLARQPRADEPTVSAAATATPAPKRTRKAVGQVSGAAARRMPVPILMYHVISRRRAGGGERRAVGRPARLRRRDARAAGGEVHGGHARAGWEAWEHGGPLPKHPIVVSFDDGYLSHYTHAKPVLRELGWPGVPVPGAQVDRPGWADRAPDPLADARGLGDRLAHAHAPGPDDARRRRAASTSWSTRGASCGSASA